MAIFLVTLGAFVAAMTVMSVGVILGQKHLRGSCGGPRIVGPDGDLMSCDTCPNKDEAHCERDREREGV